MGSHKRYTVDIDGVRYESMTVPAIAKICDRSPIFFYDRLKRNMNINEAVEEALDLDLYPKRNNQHTKDNSSYSLKGQTEASKCRVVEATALNNLKRFGWWFYGRRLTHG